MATNARTDEGTLVVGSMERKSVESGSEYFDLGQTYHRFELGGMGSPSSNPIFAIKGSFPVDPEAVEAIRLKLIDETTTYYASTYPELDLNTQLMIEKLLYM